MTNLGRIVGKQAWVELAKSLLKMLHRELGRVRARSPMPGPTSRGSRSQSPLALMDIVRKYGVGCSRTPG